MSKNKKSFFERLTGGVDMEDDLDNVDSMEKRVKSENLGSEEDETAEGQLTVDVHQTPTDIVIKAMVAGVKPEDMEISITRDMVTIKGKREENREVTEENFFYKELYWGSFSRTILLPQEVDVEAAEATERHGLLTIKLPKVDKEKKTKIKVKSGN